MRCISPFLLAALLVSGCASNHSAVAPASREAHAISSLWWQFFWVLGIIYILVVATVLICRFKSRRDRANINLPQPADSIPGESKTHRVIAILTGVSVVILLGLLVDDLFASRVLAPKNDPGALNLTVTGHQWWWEIEYGDQDPSKVFQTANEIHIPVGRTISFTLRSPDVIHSLWVPSLHGKKDLVPGHPATLVLRAEKPGIYWGQCAEFCGAQHANMGLLIKAESASDFAAWEDAARKSAVAPMTDQQKHGQQIFLNSTCVMCHAVSGTIAGSHNGPELTHLASRQTIAAGTLPNTRENLALWIQEPQLVKPGARMPGTGLQPNDLADLLDYLQTLK